MQRVQNAATGLPRLRAATGHRVGHSCGRDAAVCDLAAMVAHPDSNSHASPSGLVFWSTAGLSSATTPPMPSSAELRCIVVLAAALLSYGLPANRIEESIVPLGASGAEQRGEALLPKRTEVGLAE